MTTSASEKHIKDWDVTDIKRHEKSQSPSASNESKSSSTTFSVSSNDYYIDPQSKKHFLTDVCPSWTPGFVLARRLSDDVRIQIAVSDLKQVISMANQPPPHKSEKMFRRYEQHIYKVLQNPSLYHRFDARPFARSTFMCRLRDSVASLLEYNWPTCIDVETLKTTWPTIDVTPSPVEGEPYIVVVGPRREKQTKLAGELIDIASGTEFIAELSNPEAVVLHSFCILLSRKILTKPLKVVNLNPALRDEMANRYDVGISDENGYSVIL